MKFRAAVAEDDDLTAAFANHLGATSPVVPPATDRIDGV